MDQFVIVIETGYKSGSANYRIHPTEPMSDQDARAEYDALHSGNSDALPSIEGAVVVDVSHTQFIRVHSARGATKLDRITLDRPPHSMHDPSPQVT